MYRKGVSHLMTEEYKSTNSNIVEKKDLGNGRKQVTFKVDASDLGKYFSDLDNKGVKYDVEGNDFKMGVGSVKSRYEPNKYDYLQGFNSNTKSYTQALRTPTDPHEKIRLANELYFKEPIIGTVIDMMVDFSASGFINECEDKDIKQLYDKWSKDIRLQEIVEQIFLEYYRSGNVSIYRSEKTAKVTKTKKTSKATAKEIYNFPAGYTILNPMNVHIEGPLLFNQEMAYLQLNEELMTMTKEGNQAIQKMIPDEVKKAVKSGRGMIPLNPELYSRITRKKQPYERYATPFLERVFEPIMYKQKLRSMDMSTIDGLINQLVTVTVGNDEYPAGDDDLEAIAQLFQSPNKAYTVFWNHTLEVTFHKPEGIDTLTHDKYKQVNDDILAGLGVSRVLIDGQGSNFSTAWVSILSLIERLDNTREKVVRWLEDEYKRVADENGFKVVPKVQFNKMNLREDNYIRDVLLAMYDRGLIDEEDLLKETGRDYDTVIQTKKRNEKNKELFYPPEQPFQGGQTGTNEGKPHKPNENQYTKRRTTPEQNSGNPPKSKANRAIAYSQQLEEEYETELVEYYNSIKADVVQLAEENQDNGLLEAMLLGALIGLFKSLSHIGDRYIDEAFNSEIVMHSTNIDVTKANKVKSDLKNWNNSYVVKLASDIKSEILNNMSKDLPVDIAVNKAFQSNAYRISAMSEAVILDSTRQAKIQGNDFAGRRTATWRAHLDEKTCGTCRGLDGRTFNINEIPPRPHSYCRCDLDFN
jgi:hypothetical protein